MIDRLQVVIRSDDDEKLEKADKNFEQFAEWDAEMHQGEGNMCETMYRFPNTKKLRMISEWCISNMLGNNITGYSIDII